MKKNGYAIIGLIIIFGMIIIAVKYTGSVLLLLDKVPSELYVLLAGIIPSIVYSKSERRKNLEMELALHKRELCQKIISGMFEIVGNHKNKATGEDVKMMTFMKELPPAMILWGSADVIKNWTIFLKSSAQAAESPVKSKIMLNAYEKLLLSMRKDLGHIDRGIAEGDLVRLFINDYDKIPEK